MQTPTNVIRLRQPEDIDDPLREVLRAGARRLLAQAVELEADAFLCAMQNLRLPDGRARLVRHGHGWEPSIQTGIGPVPVTRVRVRDRGASEPEDRVRFTSTLLPKWARRIRQAQRHGARRAWLLQLLARRATKVAAVAVANKTARMVWALMTSGEAYREPAVAAA